MKPIYVGHFAKPGWRGKLPFYLVVCEKHGPFVTYPQGFDELLVCENCRSEEDARRTRERGADSRS